MQQIIEGGGFFLALSLSLVLVMFLMIYLNRVHMKQTVKIDRIGFFIVETRVWCNQKIYFYAKSDPTRAEKLDEVVANHKESAQQFMDIIKRHKL